MTPYKLFAPLPPLHPLVFTTLAFMLGICWQSNACTLSLLCFLSISLLLIAHITINSSTNRYMVIATVCISFSAGYFASHAQKKSFYRWIHAFQQPTDIVATITDITKCSTKNYAFITTAHIEKIHTTNYSDTTPWQTTPYYLVIYSKKRPSALVQDRIFLSSTKISTPSHESWHKYALKHSIGGTLFCNKLTYSHISRPSWSLKRWLWSKRQSFSKRLLKKMSHLTATFYSLLFMGTHHQSKKNSQSLRTTFQLWGILHYLARSGLHLVVFIMIWNSLLLTIPCSYSMREGLLLLLSIIYFLLSWPSLSFVRAFTTYLLYQISKLYLRPPNTLYILTLVTLFFLVINPIHLFCLDFQLSFGLTFALAWLQSNNYGRNSSRTNP